MDWDEDERPRVVTDVAEENRRLLRLAITAATTSPDPSTQNAALLVRRKTIAGEIHQWPIAGPEVNAFPRGVNELVERWERPMKYRFVEHAERAAIYRAVRDGDYAAGSTMVCPWAACADCARAIIGAGVVELITLHREIHERWDLSIGSGDAMLAEAGVTVTFVDGPLEECPKILRNGRLVSL